MLRAVGRSLSVDVRFLHLSSRGLCLADPERSPVAFPAVGCVGSGVLPRLLCVCYR
jgi:hypothetical protein